MSQEEAAFGLFMEKCYERKSIKENETRFNVEELAPEEFPKRARAEWNMFSKAEKDKFRSKLSKEEVESPQFSQVPLETPFCGQLLFIIFVFPEILTYELISD